MKCAGHIDLDAVGTCNHCGRGLCSECAAIFSPPLCDHCALAHNQGVATSFWTQLAVMVVLFVAVLAFLVSNAAPWTSALGYAAMAGFFPPGWCFLGRYFSPSGNYMFAAARWTNLVLHVVVAALIGVIVGPIYLFKAWNELKIVKKTQEEVAQR